MGYRVQVLASTSEKEITKLINDWLDLNEDKVILRTYEFSIQMSNACMIGPVWSAHIWYQKK